MDSSGYAAASEATEEQKLGRWQDLQLVKAIQESGLAPSSKQAYERVIRMLDAVRREQDTLRLAGGGCECTDSLCRWLLDVDNTWRAIEHKYAAINTRHQIVKTILALFKYVLGCTSSRDSSVGEGERHNQACCDDCGPAHEAWGLIMRQLDETTRNRVLSSEMSERESNAWVDFSEAQALEAELRANPLQHGSLEHLLVAMYTLTEPVRGGDLGRVHLLHTSADGTDAVNVETPGNVLLVPPNGGLCVLLLREHKTSTSHGMLRRVLCQALSDTVRASITRLPRTMLFVSPKNQPFATEGAFTQWANRNFARLFNKPVTANILRHSFITTLHAQNAPTAALVATAKRMGHGLATAVAYRRITRERPATVINLDTGEVLLLKPSK